MNNECHRKPNIEILKKVFLWFPVDLKHTNVFLNINPK